MPHDPHLHTTWLGVFPLIRNHRELREGFGEDSSILTHVIPVFLSHDGYLVRTLKTAAREYILEVWRHHRE